VEKSSTDVITFWKQAGKLNYYGKEQILSLEEQIKLYEEHFST
ncbi:7912_t:CDS:1, partial [Ambispora gerdemannii]